MKATISKIEKQLQTLTVLVRTLKEQTGVDNRPPKLTRRQREAYVAERIANGTPLTKKELETLNN